MTLKDIAKATGFGVSTVSSVLSGNAAKFGIKAETVKKINEKAQQLGYCRNDLAAQIQSGKSNALSMFFPEKAGSHLYKAFLKASCTIETNYIIRPTLLTEDGNIEELIKGEISQRPAAIIAINNLGSGRDTLFDYAKRFKLPVAAVDFYSEKADFNVLSDDKSGIEQVVAWLYSLGHKSIAHATEEIECQYASQRLLLYKNACDKFRIAMPEQFCFHDKHTNINRKLLNDFITRLLQKKNGPKVITCGTDYLANEIMMMLLAKGVKIPDEMSVIGFDNLEFIRHTVPLLSSISQQWDRLAECVIKTMTSFLNGNKIKKEYYIPTSLIKAESVASYNDVQ